ncbi:hypothetical protein [Oceaniglobus ichthyenteri]|uniref:hypothetical protein n=1 Tax=Oceaniglobus ichthyenteri TaxID=2136177 RepID=UPI000F84C674|nr:hypothetical protein [Oceaniglobus ichthyenteri]
MVQHLRLWLSCGFVGLALVGCGAPAPTDAPVRGLAAETAGVDADGEPIVAEAQAEVAGPTDRKGLFGFLSRKAPEVDVETVAPETQAEAEQTAGPEEVVATPDEAPRRGLFGGLFGGGGGSAPTPVALAANAAPGAEAASGEVAKGTVLPFGQVAKVCGLSSGELGQGVDQFPKEGRARWQLHDPVPASTGARSQYITGFKDRCARQVTGAMVLFGNADVHEATRYVSTNSRPYTATDDAYEKVKSRLCGVRPGVPCPADRQDRLAKAVSFVTVYSRFGATDEWYELLLVNGELEAASMSGL